MAFLLVTPTDATPMMKLQQRDWNHPPRPEKLGMARTANGVGRIPGLWAVRGSPDSDADIPQAGNRPVGRVSARVGEGIFAQGDGGRWP